MGKMNDFQRCEGGEGVLKSWTEIVGYKLIHKIRRYIYFSLIFRNILSRLETGGVIRDVIIINTPIDNGSWPISAREFRPSL